MHHFYSTVDFKKIYGKRIRKKSTAKVIFSSVLSLFFNLFAVLFVVLFSKKNRIDIKSMYIKIIIKMDKVSQIDRVTQMKEIQSKALELFTRKNADYGDAFAKYGVIGVLMRIEDKIQRSLSITKNGVNLVSDEGIKDTLLDLHNYAAMALMLLEEK